MNSKCRPWRRWTFSVVLVALAGLFGHSLFELRSVDLGFRNQNVVAFNLDFPRPLRAETRTPIRQLTGQPSVELCLWPVALRLGSGSLAA